MAADDGGQIATRTLAIALDVAKRDGQPNAEVKVDVPPDAAGERSFRLATRQQRRERPMR